MPRSISRVRRRHRPSSTRSFQEQFEQCPPELRGTRQSLRQRRRVVEQEEVPGTRVSVFLYGTLKTKFANYNAYLSCAVSRGQARYVHDAKTMASFDLVLWGDRDVPGMVDGPPLEEGRHVHGEVFECDHNTLAALDDFFEDGPALYRRRLIRVTRTSDRTRQSGDKISLLPQGRRHNDEDDDVASVYCWLLQDPHRQTNQSHTLTEYTQSEQATYTNPTFQPNVLELITGVDATHFLKFRHNVDKSFEDVWREALGHPPQFKECSSVRFSDFSLNHIPHTPMLLNTFRLLGLLFWLVGPISMLYLVYSLIYIVYMNQQNGTGWSKSIYYQLYYSTTETSEITEITGTTGSTENMGNIENTSNLHSSLSFYLIVWSHVETLFWIWMQGRMHYYGRPLIPTSPKTTTKWRSDEFQKYCRTEMYDKARGRQWFVGLFLSVGNGSASVSYSELKFDNIQDMWASRLFDTNTMNVLNDNERKELRHYVEVTVDMLGGGSVGRSHDVRLMSPHFDPFVAEHHPLLFYFITEFIFEVLISWVFLRWHGFAENKSMNGMRYWYKKGSTSNSARGTPPLPLMMFPGVGVGFLPYMPFFQTLGSSRDLYLVELPFIYLRIWGGFDVYPKSKICNFVKNIAMEHNIQKLHLIGHSFGTSCVSMAMKDEYIRDKLVHEVTMIDPLPFSMQSGDIVKDFIYDPFEDGRVYLVNREPHLVHTMMRTMNYADIVLWPDDLKSWRNPPIVIMSGKDTIVPSARIKELLMQQQHVVANTNRPFRQQNNDENEKLNLLEATETPAKVVVVWLSDTDHGGFLFDSNVLHEVEECVLNPPRPAEGEYTLYKLVTSARQSLPLLKKKKKVIAMGLLE